MMENISNSKASNDIIRPNEIQLNVGTSQPLPYNIQTSTPTPVYIQYNGVSYPNHVGMIIQQNPSNVTRLTYRNILILLYLAIGFNCNNCIDNNKKNDPSWK